MAAGGAALAVVALRGAWTALPVGGRGRGRGAAARPAVQRASRPGGPPPWSAWPRSWPRTAPAASRWARYHAFTRNLVFYTGLKQADLRRRRPARRGSSPRRTACSLVLPERDLAAVAAAAPAGRGVLARVRHLNTANLRLRSVLNPDPEVELETVVLVANK